MKWVQIMSKITSLLGLILIAGMIAAGCDSVVDGDTDTHESLTQIEGIMSNAAHGGAAITAPGSGEVVYENSLTLTANDPNIENATANDVHWALVAETNTDPRPCTGDIKFNRVNHPYTFSEDGFFEASVDLQGLEAGEYCFVFNTELENPEDGDRVVQYFYIVDEYAKVGGTIGIGKAGPGNSPTHSFDGVVGNAGSAGTVGSITVNDREGEGYCTLLPTSLNILASAAGGERALMYVNSTCWGDDLDFRVLDRDNNSSALTRGGVYFPELGLVSNGGDPFYNWVPMERGNNHVGTR